MNKNKMYFDSTIIFRILRDHAEGKITDSEKNTFIEFYLVAL